MTSGLLLDTHVWIWSMVNHSQLHPKVAARIKGHGDACRISSISVLEAMLLDEKGRLNIPGPGSKYFREFLNHSPIEEIAVDSGVIFESRKILLQHPDPYDRIIVATALRYGLTLVTADDTLLHAGVCKVLPAS